MKTTRGRPTVFTPEIADAICTRLATGASLRSICADPYMPPHPTILEWVKDNRGADENGANGFADRYARARLIGYESMAEEIIEISDADITFNGAPDSALVQQARLRSDNRKWLLAKMHPRQFGDKVTQELVGSSDAPLVTMIQLVGVAPPERREAPGPAGGDKAIAAPLKVAASR